MQPNGLAFSPDESLLYVVDNGFSSRPDGPRQIRRFSVGPDLTLADGDVLATCDAGIFDGLRIDTAGRLWVAAGDGVRCYDPSEVLIGRIAIPEAVSNSASGAEAEQALHHRDHLSRHHSGECLGLPVSGANVCEATPPSLEQKMLNSHSLTRVPASGCRPGTHQWVRKTLVSNVCG